MLKFDGWHRGVLALTLFIFAGCAEAGTPRAEIGAPAPEYVAETLDGDSVRLADLQGRVVLLNVWATWCPPCREEIPALQEIHERFSPQGFEVLGVSIDGRSERENVRRFMSEMKVTYPLWHDADDLISNRFQIIGMPTTFLIGRNGKILWRHIGPVTADDPLLHEAVERALRS